MYKIVIGVDVSKEVLDIAYSLKNEIQYLKQVKNSALGIADFLRTLQQITGVDSTSSWLVCFENTGTYSKLLLSTLLSLNIHCIEQNAALINVFCVLRRGKRDDWDACRICEYAVAHQEDLILSKLTDGNITKLKHLFSYRSVLVEKKKALSNAVSEKAETLEEKFIGQINDMNKEIIDLINQKIKAIEKEMKAIINSQKDLKKNFKLATSVVGIGKIIGIGLIIKTENFIKFVDPRKFASQIGVAPFPKQSGKSYSKPKVSKRADIAMKALISNGVTAAINFDPQLKQYNMRLIEKGKPAGVRRNNIKNKLIHRVFSVVKRGTPYVKLVA